MRRALLLVVTVLGLVVGAATVSALQDTTPPPEPTGGVAPPPSASADAVIPTAPAPEPRERVLLVWSPGALPGGAADAIAELAQVETVSAVGGGVVDLVTSRGPDGEPVDEIHDGWAIPLDALTIDPTTYPLMVPKGSKATLTGLAPGEVVLSETSAELRDLGPGSSLELTGGDGFEVRAVLPDDLVGAAEVVFTAADTHRLDVTPNRFVLVSYRGDRAALEEAIRALLPPDTPVRMRGPGETPYLRHGDAVLPQSHVKAIFGEFAYRPPEHGRDFEQDPEWIAENIVTQEVAILGQVRCHRGIMAALERALDELVRRGLTDLIDPDGYAGCWAPRLISEDGSVSRHAWGITVDVNADGNPTGVGSGQDPRLVETMERWGFTWGGFWLIPDPMHFEYLEPPDPTRTD